MVHSLFVPLPAEQARLVLRVYQDSAVRFEVISAQGGCVIAVMVLDQSNWSPKILKQRQSQKKAARFLGQLRDRFALELAPAANALGLGHAAGS